MGYMTGFGNEFATEAVKDALPPKGNTPQAVAHGLYTEQISGSSFTTPRAQNKRSWLYRIQPSVKHQPFTQIDMGKLLSNPFTNNATPNQLRWSPFDQPDKPTDFIEGLITFCGGGDRHSWTGLAIHIYACNSSMESRFFYNSDAEMLIIPQSGDLKLRTEMGIIDIKPGEISVIPRGVTFTVDLMDDNAYGYVCENHGLPFQLPDLGPIGANGLANARDFLTPVAAFEDIKGDFDLVTKFDGQLWSAKIDHSPLNVVAWHGNYAPYKYDLSKFCVINSVSFDHLDPSIFTVLTSPSNTVGVANIDFVIFSDRWMVAEDTFRPPYYHRNIMSEFMGMIKGVYDGKEDKGGFIAGGASLHNCMTPHGPDTNAFEKASSGEQKPAKLKNTLAFMLESCFVMKPTDQALNSDKIQPDYFKCWQELPHNFSKDT